MRQGYTAFAAIVVSALVATPLVMNAGKALATAERSVSVAQTVAVAAPAVLDACTTRKVRVVYSGYAAAPTACTLTR